MCFIDGLIILYASFHIKFHLMFWFRIGKALAKLHEHMFESFDQIYHYEL